MHVHVDFGRHAFLQTRSFGSERYAGNSQPGKPSMGGRAWPAVEAPFPSEATGRLSLSTHLTEGPPSVKSRASRTVIPLTYRISINLDALTVCTQDAPIFAEEVDRWHASQGTPRYA